MTSPQGGSGPDQHASPVSALSPHNRTDSSDRDADAPEAVDPAMTPSTFVASPATDYSHPRTATSSHADGTDEGAKEVFTYDKSEKIAVPTAYEYQNSPYPQVVGVQNEDHERGGDAEHNVGGAPSKSKKEPQAKILGLKRRTFFILLVIMCVVIAVAVGGGVGGALGSKKSNSSSGTTDSAATNESSSVSSSTTAPTSTPSATTPSTSATKSSSSSSTAPSSTATFLNQTNTDSGHFFQGFSKPNMTGEHTSIVSEVDGADFAFDVHSYQFIARNTNCCLSFCTNATREGWLGYVCESKTQNDAADVFSRVFVWCSDKRTAAVARGRCAK
ncbi:hypothetical protein LMH87_005183 [Akanthomyces muscarius]|uniref:Uncharacterized protein n=1 Tax=Akanthomyces muscarius TaxID=2231603 RepID=A0A9W8QLB7_AKAMU|nr:hypothetical protein LMH87_005183 [Akanthomyces muscarius]KAJ4163455.1 hypothetical protein LMH87_005183 [Akanthomyces muscarius]